MDYNKGYDGIEIISLTKGSSQLLNTVRELYGNNIANIDTINDGRSKYENRLVIKKGFTTPEELE